MKIQWQLCRLQNKVDMDVFTYYNKITPYEAKDDT